MGANFPPQQLKFWSGISTIYYISIAMFYLCSNLLPLSTIALHLNTYFNVLLSLFADTLI